MAGKTMKTLKSATFLINKILDIKFERLRPRLPPLGLTCHFVGRPIRPCYRTPLDSIGASTQGQLHVTAVLARMTHDTGDDRRDSFAAS